MIYYNGSTYEGGWLDDRKHLKGKMIDTATGDIFSGEYIDGKRNGKGRMYFH
jgi:MORN repeat